MASPQSGDLPPFMPYPPAGIRARIPDQEWNTCYDLWATLCRAYSQLPSHTLAASLEPSGSLLPFLASFAEGETNHTAHLPPSDTSLKARREYLRLCYYVLTAPDDLPSELLSWAFLGRLCKLYGSIGTLRQLLTKVWERHESGIEKPLGTLKSKLITELDSLKSQSVDDNSFAQCLLPLMRTHPPAATFMITGSDLLDSIISAYPKLSTAAQQRLLILVFLGLDSLLSTTSPNVSLLSDHLYTLGKAAESSSSASAANITYDLITDTPFLHRTQARLITTPSTRATALLTSLEKFRKPSTARPKRPSHRRLDKGKGRDSSQNNIHIHRLSLITQIQDLFPDLGSLFITALLDEYNDNVETVTAHLLDDSLPPHLASLDRTARLPPPQQQTEPAEIAASLVPRSTPPPQHSHAAPRIPSRRNVYDNDELDRLSSSALAKLHIGPKNADATADSVLAEPGDRTASKAAIMAALAVFDADDDEHDDTYDAEDVGGTVDSGTATGAEAGQQQDEALFRAWTAGPAVFERDAATRRGKERHALRTATGLTDEAIEGWGIMLRRDPKRVRRLEARFATFAGQQTELERTSWKANEEGESADENGRNGGGEGRGGRGGGRGRGRGRGRGGNVAGPADEKSTQVARQRKEAGKGSRANHNRRDQRAKKMARGGGMAG